MSRRRYISTDISTDPRIAELAEQGALPVLLYTWAIAHADDWGRMTGDARQFKLLVCPGFDLTAREVDAALTQIAEVGLWLRYTVDGRDYLAFPPTAWLRYQTYIGRDKRTRDGSAMPAPSDPTYRVSPQTLPHDELQDETHTAAPPAASPAASPAARQVASDTLRDVWEDVWEDARGSAQHQTMPHIPEDHRATPQNAAERRRTPLHARTLSLSLSPSPSLSPSTHDGQGDSQEREHAHEQHVATFAADAARSPSLVPSPVSSVSSASSKVTPLRTPPTTTARLPDPVWDACIAAMGAAPSNRVERGKWATGIKALKESLTAAAPPGAAITPITAAMAAEIGVRSLRYRARFGPSVPLNPMALAGNWTTLSTDVPPVSPAAQTAQKGYPHGQQSGQGTGQRSGYASYGRGRGRDSGKPAIGSAAYYAQAAATTAAAQSVQSAASTTTQRPASHNGGADGEGLHAAALNQRREAAVG